MNKGYKKVTLQSPCKRFKKQFTIQGERLSDDRLKRLGPDNQQWLLKRYLSKGWKPVPKPSNSSNGGAQAMARDSGQLRRAMSQFGGSMPSPSRNSGREGDIPPEELINIDGTRYSKFISTLATMQNIGGGKRLAQIGIGIDVPEFARHMIGELDFEPWLYRPVLMPAKRFLLSVDSSGSCMHLIPITRAIAKLLSHYRELSVESYENFNGEVYDKDIKEKIDQGHYDFIIYLGDDDVAWSHLQTCDTKTIAFVSPRHEEYLKSKNSKSFLAHGVDFNFGDDMAEGLLKAREYFESVE